MNDAFCVLQEAVGQVCVLSKGIRVTYFRAESEARLARIRFSRAPFRKQRGTEYQAVGFGGLGMIRSGGKIAKSSEFIKCRSIFSWMQLIELAPSHESWRNQAQSLSREGTDHFQNIHLL